MLDLFSENARRDPFPLYENLRNIAPVFREPQSGLWMLFGYDEVKRALTDHETFSSQHGPDWLIFSDPPRHSKLRLLISQAFTPRSIVELEPRIRELTRELLNPHIERGEMDLATDFSVQLPMLIIAEMLGIPPADWERFKHWTDVILQMSYTVPGGSGATEAVAAFAAASAEMDAYLASLIPARQLKPTEDLLTRLVHAEVDGEHLTRQEILGFFQLLLLAGSETTTNLINNAFLCLSEHPEQLSHLREDLGLLQSAIEEVLRYRSPVQWMYRVTRHDVEIRKQVIPAGNLVLAVIGSANRDPQVFTDPNLFDITRTPNPHVAFGHGIHFCLGASLARMESKITLNEILIRLKQMERTSNEPWEPRKGLHVLGPSRLPIRFKPCNA